jgi:hypothetical protein
VPLQPGDVIVVCLLAFALIGVPAAVAYLVFGVLRREAPTEVPTPVDAEPERVGAAPRHGRRHATRSHRATRSPSLDLRNRFGRS